ncbi:hypothetical protein GCM10010129_17430 [Streptomyces fumigatiscleroticus]|nr:hypothetical protein GCM10010129_17430 [Streptomyces fumigatiscleroticus]
MTKTGAFFMTAATSPDSDGDPRDPAGRPGPAPESPARPFSRALEWQPAIAALVAAAATVIAAWLTAAGGAVGDPGASPPPLAVAPRTPAVPRIWGVTSEFHRTGLGTLYRFTGWVADPLPNGKVFVYRSSGSSLTLLSAAEVSKDGSWTVSGWVDSSVPAGELGVRCLPADMDTLIAPDFDGAEGSAKGGTGR